MSKESALKSEKYSYNSQNRLCESIVIDRQNKTQAVSYYGYDAFGRRVVVQDRDEACMRSLYDGFTFDVIKQSPTLANGMFVDSNETGLRLNRTGKATGDRYRYLDDDTNDGNRYFYLNDGNYKSVTSRYVGERTSITVNGVVAAQNAGCEVSYFTTDLLGSVRTTTDSAGFGTNNYTYDVFGSLVEGDLSGETNYGYLGKQFDPQTGLYNYGYRDYAPVIARFTTVDPICDGNNWFCYVNNDPVNFLDPTGLFAYGPDGQQYSTYNYEKENDTQDSKGIVVTMLINGTAAAGTGTSGGVGITIGYSKEEGMSVGLVKTISIGAQEGASLNAGISIGIDYNSSKVQSGKSNSFTVGGSFAGFGGDISTD